MRTTFRTWFNNVPFNDPLLRRQVLLLQGWIIVVLMLDTPGIFLAPPGGSTGIDSVLRLAASIALLIGLGISLFLLRHGFLQLTILMIVVTLVIIQLMVLIVVGLDDGAIVLLLSSVPLILTGMLSSRRLVLLTFGLEFAIIIVVAILERQTPPLAGLIPGIDNNLPIVLGIFLISGVMVIFFLDLFARTFREALALARQREQELKYLQHTQADTIAERTEELEQALQTSKQQHQQLQSTVDALHTSQTTIQSLMAPLIPILPGVVVVPLTGQLDAQRIAELTDQLLETVATQHSQSVIIDVTGLSVIDEVVAGGIHALAAGLNLMGTEILLVGIRPEVAQTMVSLGLDTYRWRTYANLQAAVQALLSTHQLRHLTNSHTV